MYPSFQLCKQNFSDIVGENIFLNKRYNNNSMFASVGAMDPFKKINTPRKGLLYVISGPSGVGKGTIVKAIRAKNPNIKVSVSVTTRQPRAGEVEGESYYFKTVEQFQTMVEQGELLEWAQFVNTYYGTPQMFVEEHLIKGHDVILEIDVKGAIQVKERMPNGVYIFIMPPTMAELESRLVKRQTEALDAMRQRLEVAMDEFNYLPLYDYQVVNDDLEQAILKVESIMLAEKCRVFRNLRGI
jgi:guanylate kinase